MAELTIPLARRSGAVGTRHLVAGVMARGVERALERDEFTFVRTRRE